MTGVYHYDEYHCEVCAPVARRIDNHRCWQHLDVKSVRHIQQSHSDAGKIMVRAIKCQVDGCEIHTTDESHLCYIHRGKVPLLGPATPRLISLATCSLCGRSVSPS